MPKYFLHSILPAVRLPEPITCGPVVFCTTNCLDSYPIEPAEYEGALRQVTRQFRDAFGQPLNCMGLELLPTDMASELAKEGLPRACRDAVALSHITNGTAWNCRHEQRLAVYESDYFDALPIRFRPGGFVIQRPGLVGLCGLDHYQPTLRTDMREPAESDFQVDEFLLNGFSQAVNTMLRGELLRELRQIFRAVAISTYGCRILHETDSTYYDLGPRIVAWVSAFETLVHEGNDPVYQRDVLALIGRIRWVDDGQPRRCGVGRKRGTLNDPIRPILGKGGQTVDHENGGAAYYRRLYNLRNDLAHGNPIDTARFAACIDYPEGPRVDDVASLLFRECVLERFRDLGIIERTHDGPTDDPGLGAYVKERMDAQHYHEALSNALFGRHRCRYTPSASLPQTEPGST